MEGVGDFFVLARFYGRSVREVLRILELVTFVIVKHSDRPFLFGIDVEVVNVVALHLLLLHLRRELDLLSFDVVVGHSYDLKVVSCRILWHHRLELLHILGKLGQFEVTNRKVLPVQIALAGWYEADSPPRRALA